MTESKSWEFISIPSVYQVLISEFDCSIVESLFIPFLECVKELGFTPNDNALIFIFEALLTKQKLSDPENKFDEELLNGS